MMGIPHPRESTQSTNHHGNIGNDSHNEHGVVRNIKIAEVVDDLEEKPYDTGECAATVNAPKVLQMKIMSIVQDQKTVLKLTWRTEVQPNRNHRGGHWW